MKNFLQAFGLMLSLSVAALTPARAGTPVGTAFTYQGQLKQGGVPVNGTIDLVVRLFDTPTKGTQLGTDQVIPGVNVANGLFAVTVNSNAAFGPTAFSGGERWLEVQVDATILEPRQAVTAAPRALSLLGLRTEFHWQSPNILGGHSLNVASEGVVGATIGGGGSETGPNVVTDDFGTVAGGASNRAGDGGEPGSGGIAATVGGGGVNSAIGVYSTVAGGAGNMASHYAALGGGFANQAAGLSSTLAGGWQNAAESEYSTIGGGKGNRTSGNSCFVGGGEANVSGGLWASIAGGSGNAASGDLSHVGGGGGNRANGQQSCVAGGSSNTAEGDSSSVGGGFGNHAQRYASVVCGGGQNRALGEYSTVAGGARNDAGGDFSFAGGKWARVRNAAQVGGDDADGDEGTFVWSDSTALAPFASTGPNQFLIRAAGGVGINRNNPAHPVHVGTDTTNGNGAHCTNTGVWTNASDRNAKENFRRVDRRELLRKLVDLPVTEWRYKGEEKSVRHVGPMAQDFRAAFGLGESETHIGTIDADGVVLAAIQGLHEIVLEKDVAMECLRAEKDAEIAELNERLTRLEAALSRDSEGKRENR